MNKLVDGAASIVSGDDRFRNPDGTPGTWVHTYTPAERFQRTILPLGIGAAIAAYLLWLAYHDSSVATTWPYTLIPLFISSLFALARWWAKTERRYSSDSARSDRRQRWKDARPFIILFAIVEVFLLYYIFDTQFRPDHWVAISIAPVVLLMPAFFALAGKGKSGYTLAAREAFEEHKQIEAQRVNAKSNEPTWLDKLTKQWWFRYPFGVFLGYAYFAYMLPDPRMTGWRFWIVTLGVIGVVIAATREVSLVLIGGALLIGLAYAIFGAIAALPVGVAIIIGALIVAHAPSDKK